MGLYNMLKKSVSRVPYKKVPKKKVPYKHKSNKG